MYLLYTDVGAPDLNRTLDFFFGIENRAKL